jgi:hypothetical protein
MWKWMRIGFGIGLGCTFGVCLGFELGEYAGENVVDWIKKNRSSKAKVIE